MMENFRNYLFVATAMVAGVAGGCTKTSADSIAGNIDISLDTAGLKDVKVRQDMDKGVVTLDGHVATDADKAHAETIAKSIAGTLVVANQIAVITPGAESEAKKVNEALDAGIESNLQAALLAERLTDSVKFSVKNHVVTLHGDVMSQELRGRAEEIATGVPYVHQVVNELQVKKQKATSSN